MNVGFRAHDCAMGEIEKLSDRLAFMGVKNIQLALRKSLKTVDFSKVTFSPGFARHIKKELDKNNIHVTVLGSYINPILEDEDARREQVNLFIENLKYAKYIGADMVGTETGNPPEGGREASYKILVKSIREIADAAEKLGVMFAVEGVYYGTLSTPEYMKRLIDDINSPNMLVIFDITNLLGVDNYQNQREIIDKAFNLYGDRIAAIHLKDFIVEDGRMKRTLFGKGLLDAEYLFSVLKERKPYIDTILEELSEYDYMECKGYVDKMFLK